MTPGRTVPVRTVTVEIDRVGAEGDGIATAADGAPFYLPFTLPGETVAAEPSRRRGDGWFAPHTDVLTTSEARVPAPCQHFGNCGGCVLQHWRVLEYRSWKAGLLEAALVRAGFVAPRLEAMQVVPAGSRRRMDLALSRQGRNVRVGLHRRGDDSVVDLHLCHVLRPELVALIAPLRALLEPLSSLRRQGSAIVNWLDDGADLLLRTDHALGLADREALIGFAGAQRLVRVSWAPLHGEPEPIVIIRPPRITFSGVACEPPPGAFLQASPAGEAAIVAAVLAGLPDRLAARSRIAECYAGCGTLSFALAKRARVAAWEGDAAAAITLRVAANHAGLAGRVAVTQRDLARRPLLASELGGFAAVVLDPPHAGAAQQTAQIAAAKVPVAIYVCCNPAALSRDARMLREAGYTLHVATPIDQFLWSARLEAVCTFHR